MTEAVLHSRPIRLALLLGAAIAVRVMLFTGFALGDDVFYLSASVALAQGEGWPPLPLHWHTRTGLTVPTALAAAVVGWHPWVFVWLPFLASLFGIWLSYRIAEHVGGERAAWIAATLYAAFPLEIIYSTHLFPDLVVGVLGALAIWLWVQALRQDSARLFVGAGMAFAAAYLCRETVLVLGPVFLVLWASCGRWRWPRVGWVIAVPLLVIGVESATYAWATGDPFYRWRAVMAQQAAPSTPTVNVEGPQETSSPQRPWVSHPALSLENWTNPLWMVVTSHEFGLFLVIALPLAGLALWRSPRLKWVALWLLVGIGWTYYGTTVPTRWAPLYVDPRYAAPFTVPMVVLIAANLAPLRTVVRTAAVAALAVTGVFAASLDQRGAPVTAHEVFLESEFASAATLEPFEYYGARWALGLERPAPFACAGDAGRSSVAQLAALLPGATVLPARERRYFVFSPERRRDLARRMEAAGWRQVAELTGRPTVTRRWVAAFLDLVPGQGARFEPVGRPPRLVVFEHPDMPPAVGAPDSAR